MIPWGDLRLRVLRQERPLVPPQAQRAWRLRPGLPQVAEERTRSQGRLPLRQRPSREIADD